MPYCAMSWRRIVSAYNLDFYYPFTYLTHRMHESIIVRTSVYNLVELLHPKKA